MLSKCKHPRSTIQFNWKTFLRKKCVCVGCVRRLNSVKAFTCHRNSPKMSLNGCERETSSTSNLTNIFMQVCCLLSIIVPSQSQWLFQCLCVPPLFSFCIQHNSQNYILFFVRYCYLPTANSAQDFIFDFLFVFVTFDSLLHCCHGRYVVSPPPPTSIYICCLLESSTYDDDDDCDNGRKVSADVAIFTAANYNNNMSVDNIVWCAQLR